MHFINESLAPVRFLGYLYISFSFSSPAQSGSLTTAAAVKSAVLCRAPMSHARVPCLIFGRACRSVYTGLSPAIYWSAGSAPARCPMSADRSWEGGRETYCRRAWRIVFKVGMAEPIRVHKMVIYRYGQQCQSNAKSTGY